MLEKNFMLKSDTAIILYNSIKDLPIIDYHSHLNAKDIYENRNFSNIGEMWLSHDHYKWRAMRGAGIAEEYITGDRNYKEKFEKWCETMEYTLFNPLYHWSHLELKNYFNCDLTINSKNSQKIYDITKKKIDNNEVTIQKIISMSNVKYIATTDDPIDDLYYHQLLQKENTVFVAPTFRPEQIYDFTKPKFNEYISKLEISTKMKIKNFSDFKQAVLNRLNYFVSCNCKITDHSLDSFIYIDTTHNEAKRIYDKHLNSIHLTHDELNKYQSYMLSFLLKNYTKHNLVCQFHIGALRNNNHKLLYNAGVDLGTDSCNDQPFIASISKLLNSVDSLPKIILYCLNPNDYYSLATMVYNFQEGPTKGKIQFGPAWWHADNIDGITKQLTVLSNVGQLRTFIGMLTDSRSFLSFSRHDYFRRILSNFIAEQYNDKLVPQDIELMKKIMKEVCFQNAYEYFELKGVIDETNI